LKYSRLICTFGIKAWCGGTFQKRKISDLILLIQKRNASKTLKLALAKPDSEKVQEVAKARIAQFK
jgi:hypothetical protein